MTSAEVAEAQIRAELTALPHSRRCLLELGRIGKKVILCQVITQGGKLGLDRHRYVVHGIGAIGQ